MRGDDEHIRATAAKAVTGLADHLGNLPSRSLMARLSPIEQDFDKGGPFVRRQPWHLYLPMVERLFCFGFLF